jgi:hypothetical protein
MFYYVNPSLIDEQLEENMNGNTNNVPAPTISATVRRAKQGADGSWFTVELSASDSVFNPVADVDWPLMAGEMAKVLDRQVQEMIMTEIEEPAWAYLSGVVRRTKEILKNKDMGNPQVSNTHTMECPNHVGVMMKRRKREDGSVFYSHNDRSTGGEWCNYQPQSI